MTVRASTLLLGLIILLYGMGGCAPGRIESKTEFSGESAISMMEELGRSLEALEPSSEDEGLVVNHMQNLWHYLRVSPNTGVTLVRTRYVSWTTARETVVGTFHNSSLGTITVSAEDTEVEGAQAADTGNIKFAEIVEFPEHGTGRGEFYPFGAEYQGNTTPPSYQLKLPGGYFVPTGGLLDATKRHMRHNEAITVLQKLVKDMFDIGQREVPPPE